MANPLEQGNMASEPDPTPSRISTTSSVAAPPAWQMPAGVDRALWNYTHEPRLAYDEDRYFQGHPLLAADLPWVIERLKPASTVADLGCGTGRAALALARLGHRVVAVDLSKPMLAQLDQMARSQRLNLLPVQANLCNLQALAPGQFDAQLLLFSTLGMVRERAARQQVLAEAARISKPSGMLLLHAHNLWENLSHPSGRAWLLRYLPKLLVGGEQAGDRPMTYRGIPNLIVHQYRLSELRADLVAGGWRIHEITPLNSATAQRVKGPTAWARFRCGGWLIMARRLAASRDR